MTIQQLVAGFSALVGMTMLILDGKTALGGAVEGVTLCFQTLIPSLFPFFLFSSLLTGAFAGSAIPLLRPLGKLFRIPPGGESFLITSFLGGYPVGAQSIASAYRNGQLLKQDAERMLAYCSNAGPSFLFGIIAFMFPDQKTVWILWGIHILSAWMVSRLIFPIGGIKNAGSSSLSITDTMASAVKTMACVSGWVILFRIILAFVNRWFFWMLEPVWQVIITGLLELSNGCCSLTRIENIALRFITCSGILALGGICVTLQTASVTQGLSLRYYYRGKLLQCIFSLVISISIVAERYLIPLLMILYFGIFYGKTKISGSNMKKAVV